MFQTGKSLKILVIDNYDSFTFNLVQLLGRNNVELIVKRNDEADIEEIKSIQPDKSLISPGPGRPENSGLSLDVIKAFGNSIPILGVCLGMQAICYLFGGEIINADQIFHGKTSSIEHDNRSVFAGLPQNFAAMRYHSLIVKQDSLPDEITITAKTSSGELMGIRHRIYSLEGIQFHPESILTPSGSQIINNWLNQ